ncbi:MAG: hypothetical protein RLZZ609_2748 [Cyanobacteriota bacterium]|jgi:hypothetical protein
MKVLRTWEDVAELRKRSARVGIRRVKLALGGQLPAEYTAQAEQRINRSLNACGCVTAAFFVVFGLIIALVGFAFKTDFPAISTSRFAVSLFCLLLTLSVFGKFVGLGISVWELNRVINQIEFGLYGQRR